jgi:hypothetical protein
MLEQLREEAVAPLAGAWIKGQGVDIYFFHHNSTLPNFYFFPMGSGANGLRSFFRKYKGVTVALESNHNFPRL